MSQFERRCRIDILTRCARRDLKAIPIDLDGATLPGHRKLVPGIGLQRQYAAVDTARTSSSAHSEVETVVLKLAEGKARCRGAVKRLDIFLRQHLFTSQRSKIDPE